MNNILTVIEYIEAALLRKRLKILDSRRVADIEYIEYPHAEFTLGEAEDIYAVINTLKNIKSVHG